MFDRTAPAACKTVKRQVPYTRVEATTTTGFNDRCLGVACLVLLLVILPGLLLVGLLQADRSLQIQAASSNAHSAHSAHSAHFGPSSRIRLLQQNCWTPLFGSGGDKTDRMNAFVEEAGAYDVLVLQEVFGSWLGWRRVLGYAPTLVHDLKLRGFTHFLTPRPSLFQFQDNGLLIASKFPLENAFEVVFEDWTSKEIWTAKGALGVRLAGRNLTIVNTHLNAYEGSSQRDTRRAQLMQLQRELPHTPDVIISGDLNVDMLAHNCSNPEFTDMVDILAPLGPLGPLVPPLRDACAYPPTWPSDRPTRRYNYILHQRTEGWQLATLERVTIGKMRGPGFSGVSDHLGIVSELVKL